MSDFEGEKSSPGSVDQAITASDGFKSLSGSLRSTSEISESGTESIFEGSGNERSPRKRGLSDVDDAQASPNKRLKAIDHDRYSVLFNETVKAGLEPAAVEIGTLQSSEIGASCWTTHEKSVFFNSLDRRGRHNVRQIAKEVGSKSEPEVAQYLELLKEELGQADKEFKVSSSTPKHLHGAAFEISQRCCEVLDDLANTLSVTQRVEEERIERSKHGRFWLLNSNIAKRVAESSVDSTGVFEARDSLPAANLLNLKMFLHLSQRFFMNSRDPELNYRTYRTRKGGVSIMYSAFAEFHDLTINIIKRLISSALFFAISRLRALENGATRHGQHVRRRDVSTALDLLGMKPNSKTYWRGVARRCNLEVWDKLRGYQTSGKRYSYDEVERLLGSDLGGRSVKVETSNAKSPGNPDDGNDVSAEEQSHKRTGSQSASDFPFTTDTDPETSDTSLTNHVPSIEAADRHEARLHERMDAMDRIQSKAEEKRLWESLGASPPPDSGSDDSDLEPVQIRRSVGRNPRDHEDWTDWLNYRAEWESFDTPVPAEAFLSTERRRRSGREREAATTEADDNETDGSAGDFSGDDDGDDTEMSEDERSSGDEAEAEAEDEDADMEMDLDPRHHHNDRASASADVEDGMPDDHKYGEDDDDIPSLGSSVSSDGNGQGTL